MHGQLVQRSRFRVLGCAVGRARPGKLFLTCQKKFPWIEHGIEDFVCRSSFAFPWMQAFQFPWHCLFFKPDLQNVLLQLQVSELPSIILLV